MLYAAICNDKPGHLQVRLDNRPAHIEWLNSINAAGGLAFAGPFLGSDEKPTGSLVVIETDNIDEATAIFAADPYNLADLFESVEIRAWNWVFNKPAQV
jgi:uncharacterized protein YciI